MARPTMVSIVPRLSTAPTSVLVAAARGGDRRAWAELVSRYQGLVRAVAGRFHLQEADVADAVQATWLRALERLDTVQDPERLGGWLTTVAHRECLALISRAGREAPAELEECELGAAEPGPEEAVLAEETRRAVTCVVAALPARRRELIRALFSTAEPSYVEIARSTGVPVGSIGPTRQRALDTLRSELLRAGHRSFVA
jgi:RNA polymerase sigma factor (sigma-70 family)